MVVVVLLLSPSRTLLMLKRLWMESMLLLLLLFICRVEIHGNTLSVELSRRNKGYDPTPGECTFYI